MPCVRERNTEGGGGRGGGGKQRARGREGEGRGGGAQGENLQPLMRLLPEEVKLKLADRGEGGEKHHTILW